MDESNADGHIHDGYKSYGMEQWVWHVPNNDGDALSMLEDPCVDIEKRLIRAERVLIHGRGSRMLSKFFLVAFGKRNNSKTNFKVQRANEGHACSYEILQVQTRQRIPHRASEESTDLSYTTYYDQLPVWEECQYEVFEKKGLKKRIQTG